MSVKNGVMFLGIVFLATGLLGFFNNPVLGLFAVDALHNIVHLVSGAVAIFMAMSGESGARQFAKVFGVIYAVVAVLGLIVPGDTFFGLMADNLADNLLHLVLAAAFLVMGYAGEQREQVDKQAGMRV